MRVELVTWKDLIDHLVDWCGSSTDQSILRDARRSSLNAVRDLANEHIWTYFLSHYRLATSAPYSTGTVEYDDTGGTFERMVTLTTGTWPSWAAYGTLVINNVTYDVNERKSGTVLTLKVNTNPGTDIAAGTSFTIYRDTYSLPSDFIAMSEIIIQNQAVVLAYERPGDLLLRERFYRGVATPRLYTHRGSPDFMNTMSISFFPPPDNAYTIDMVYRRQPRSLRIDNYSTGTVSTGSSSATLTGVGTVWTSSMVGSVVRVSADRVNTPTARWGSNPALYERLITAVSSGTSLTMDDTVDGTYTGNKYLISDPVDVEVTSMLTAVLRCAEMQTGYARNREDYRKFEAAYRDALIRAREADARNFKDESSGGRRAYPARLADYPLGPDS